MKFGYGRTLDYDEMLENDIQAMFINFSAEVNANNLDPDQILPAAIRERNLRHSPVLHLHSKKGHGYDAMTGITASNQWHDIGINVKYSPGVNTATDRGETGKPVVELVGHYEANAFDLGTKFISIGWSVDGGTSFTIINQSIRPIGYRNTRDQASRGAAALWVPQAHYMTGTAGWRPTGAYRGKQTLTCCHVGGGHDDDHVIPDSSLITHFALLLFGDNTTQDIHPWDVAGLAVVGRG